MTETEVSIRIDLESGGRIGPGKIALLEAIRPRRDGDVENPQSRVRGVIPAKQNY